MRASLRRQRRLEYPLGHVVTVPVLLALMALYCRNSRLNFRIVDAFYNTASVGFPWRHAEWLEVIGHQLARLLPVGLGAVTLGAAFASRWIPALRPWRALLWSLAAALCVGPLLIANLKQMTAPPCPWNLKRYGGYADMAVQWFAISRAEAGLCLPSGHAGTGFSMLALYFAGWAGGSARWRWRGLLIGSVAGLVFDAVRMVQGAQFLDQVIWSVLACWLVAAIVFAPLICVGDRLTSR
ncbi:MAG: phosphatase PAP2 family protein [Dokdonella sp.]